MGALKDELNGLMDTYFINPEDIINGLNNLDLTIINDAMRDRALHGVSEIHITINHDSIYTNSIYKNFKIDFGSLCNKKCTANNDNLNGIRNAVFDWFKQKYSVEENMDTRMNNSDTIIISWR